MNVLEVEDSNFEEMVLSARNPVLVDFGAEWCPPCRAMEPVLSSLADDFNGRARVAKLNVDHNPEITAQYQVRNLPTFLLFQNGELKDRVVGAVPKKVLEDKLKMMTGS